MVPMSDVAPTVSFPTTLIQDDGSNACGIVVPDDVIERLGAGKRPPVLVDLDGYAYRTTVAVMGGQYMFGVPAPVRQATGLGGGDSVTVGLTVATTPREVAISDDFAAALDAEPAARAFFDRLSNSLQRFHVDNVNGAKTDDTRQRRIDKAVALFLAGKQR